MQSRDECRSRGERRRDDAETRGGAELREVQSRDQRREQREQRAGRDENSSGRDENRLETETQSESENT